VKQELYSHYDFILIGDHPAALWGARLLLERGAKVLAVPMGTDRARALAPRFALESLDIPERDWVNREVDPIQILTPDRRFRVLSSWEAFRQECAFVDGSDPASFESLNPQLIRGLAYLDRGAETGPVSSADWKAIAQRLNETVYFEKPASWLKERFLDQLRKLGGHVLPNGHLTRIFIERKTVVGIQVEGSSSMITASRVVAACNWTLIQRLIGEAILPRSNPLGWMFETRFKISKEAIPIGLTSRMLWVQAGSPVIEIEAVNDGRLTGEFVLRTALPFADYTLERIEQRKTAQRLLKVMEKIIPDLEYNLSRVYPDIRDPERTEQVDLVEMYPFHTLNQIPSSRLVYAAPGLGHETAISGLGLAYEESDPQMGERGAYHSMQLLIQEWAKSTQQTDFKMDFTTDFNKN